MSKNTTVVQFDHVTFTYPETVDPVFTDISLELPRGVVSLVGQNGTGKSTALLLAGGRIFPDNGTVTLLGKDTREIEGEEQRNMMASFIYQNMEFETEEPIEDLMHFIYSNGFHNKKDKKIIETLANVFELKECLDKKLQKLSKGQLQRAILAFSLLYGSRVIIMDEPIFALEDYRKTKVMQFLVEYAGLNGISIYYSAHELEISRKFADFILLFYKNGQFKLGKPQELLTEKNLEDAYEYPPAMLYQKEHFYRSSLMGLPGVAKSGRQGQN